jgi:Tfp pilus assembly protein PilF
MLARAGHFAEARSELEIALKADPSFAPAQRMLTDIQKLQPNR